MLMEAVEAAGAAGADTTAVASAGCGAGTVRGRRRPGWPVTAVGGGVSSTIMEDDEAGAADEDDAGVVEAACAAAAAAARASAVAVFVFKALAALAACLSGNSKPTMPIPRNLLHHVSCVGLKPASSAVRTSAMIRKIRAIAIASGDRSTFG